MRLLYWCIIFYLPMMELIENNSPKQYEVPIYDFNTLMAGILSQIANMQEYDDFAPIIEAIRSNILRGEANMVAARAFLLTEVEENLQAEIVFVAKQIVNAGIVAAELSMHQAMRRGDNL